MDDEVELVSDGEGLAVFGRVSAVEQFMASMGILAESRDLRLAKWAPTLRATSEIAVQAADSAMESGRWVKLTAESADKMKRFGLIGTDSPRVSHAVAGQRGDIKAWLQVEDGAGVVASNPALLSSAAGVMAQLARQQEINELKAYLARIDAKIDDVLRGQINAELKRLGGTRDDLEQPWSVLETTGRIDDDTWSRVQGRTQSVSDTLEWALLELGSVADKLENLTDPGEAKLVATDAVAKVQTLAAVVAHCFELQDSIDEIQIERARSLPPEEIDRLRQGLDLARDTRRERTCERIASALDRMSVVIGAVDSRQLLYPATPGIVRDAIEKVWAIGADFLEILAVPYSPATPSLTRWLDAVRDGDQWSAAVKAKRGQAVLGTAAATAAAIGLAAKTLRDAPNKGA